MATNVDDRTKPSSCDHFPDHISDVNRLFDTIIDEYQEKAIQNELDDVLRKIRDKMDTPIFAGILSRGFLPFIDKDPGEFWSRFFIQCPPNSPVVIPLVHQFMPLHRVNLPGYLEQDDNAKYRSNWNHIAETSEWTYQDRMPTLIHDNMYSSQFQLSNPPRGMCPISFLGNHTCHMWYYKGNLYCNHGYTNNAFSKAHLDFRLLVPPPRITPVQFADTYIRGQESLYPTKHAFLQNSENISCPIETSHETGTVFVAGGGLLCIHGYCNGTDWNKISTETEHDKYLHEWKTKAERDIEYSRNIHQAMGSYNSSNDPCKESGGKQPSRKPGMTNYDDRKVLSGKVQKNTSTKRKQKTERGRKRKFQRRGTLSQKNVMHTYSDESCSDGFVAKYITPMMKLYVDVCKSPEFPTAVCASYREKNGIQHDIHWLKESPPLATMESLIDTAKSRIEEVPLLKLQITTAMDNLQKQPDNNVLVAEVLQLVSVEILQRQPTVAESPEDQLAKAIENLHLGEQSKDHAPINDKNPGTDENKSEIRDDEKVMAVDGTHDVPDLTTDSDDSSEDEVQAVRNKKGTNKSSFGIILESIRGEILEYFHELKAKQEAKKVAIEEDWRKQLSEETDPEHICVHGIENPLSLGDQQFTCSMTDALAKCTIWEAMTDECDLGVPTDPEGLRRLDLLDTLDSSIEGIVKRNPLVHMLPPLPYNIFMYLAMPCPHGHHQPMTLHGPLIHCRAKTTEERCGITDPNCIHGHKNPFCIEKTEVWCCATNKEVSCQIQPYDETIAADSEDTDGDEINAEEHLSVGGMTNGADTQMDSPFTEKKKSDPEDTLEGNSLKERASDSDDIIEEDEVSEDSHQNLEEDAKDVFRHGYTSNEAVDPHPNGLREVGKYLADHLHMDSNPKSLDEQLIEAPISHRCVHGNITPLIDEEIPYHCTALLEYDWCPIDALRRRKNLPDTDAQVKNAIFHNSDRCVHGRKNPTLYKGSKSGVVKCYAKKVQESCEIKNHIFHQIDWSSDLPQNGICVHGFKMPARRWEDIYVNCYSQNVEDWCHVENNTCVHGLDNPSEVVGIQVICTSACISEKCNIKRAQTASMAIQEEKEDCHPEQDTKECSQLIDETANSIHTIPGILQEPCIHGVIYPRIRGGPRIHCSAVHLKDRCAISAEKCVHGKANPSDEHQPGKYLIWCIAQNSNQKCGMTKSNLNNYISQKPFDPDYLKPPKGNLLEFNKGAVCIHGNPNPYVTHRNRTIKCSKGSSDTYCPIDGLKVQVMSDMSKKLTGTSKQETIESRGKINGTQSKEASLDKQTTSISGTNGKRCAHGFFKHQIRSGVLLTCEARDSNQWCVHSSFRCIHGKPNPSQHLGREQVCQAVEPHYWCCITYQQAHIKKNQKHKGPKDKTQRPPTPVAVNFAPLLRRPKMSLVKNAKELYDQQYFCVHGVKNPVHRFGAKVYCMASNLDTSCIAQRDKCIHGYANPSTVNGTKVYCRPVSGKVPAEQQTCPIMCLKQKCPWVGGRHIANCPLIKRRSFSTHPPQPLQKYVQPPYLVHLQGPTQPQYHPYTWNNRKQSRSHPAAYGYGTSRRGSFQTKFTPYRMGHY